MPVFFFNTYVINFFTALFVDFGMKTIKTFRYKFKNVVYWLKVESFVINVIHENCKIMYKIKWLNNNANKLMLT